MSLLHALPGDGRRKDLDKIQENIGAALAEACDGLAQLGIATRISRDSHYQLSNRLAFTWKLATLGVPTVLVYLGFIGDEGIRDAGEGLLEDEQACKRPGEGRLAKRRPLLSQRPPGEAKDCKTPYLSSFCCCK